MKTIYFLPGSSPYFSKFVQFYLFRICVWYYLFGRQYSIQILLFEDETISYIHKVHISSQVPIKSIVELVILQDEEYHAYIVRHIFDRINSGTVPVLVGFSIGGYYAAILSSMLDITAVTSEGMFTTTLQTKYPTDKLTNIFHKHSAIGGTGYTDICVHTSRNPIEQAVVWSMEWTKTRLYLIYVLLSYILHFRMLFHSELYYQISRLLDAG